MKALYHHWKRTLLVIAVYTILFSPLLMAVLYITSKQQIREFFRDMAHEMGKCVIVVTHSQEFAKGADTIIRLNNKKLMTD